MPYKDPDKQRKYQRERCARIRKIWMDANGPCVKCGAAEDLHVDHVDPETKVTHKVWSWSETRREQELAKCQVLCAECHREKTREWHRSRTLHGTYAMRNTWKCTCEECLNYVKTAKREWRKTTGKH